MHGYRELVYFLSRLPKSKDLGEWKYNPRSDCWVNGIHRMKVAVEATESIATCLHLGLTREEIDKFIFDNEQKEEMEHEIS